MFVKYPEVSFVTRLNSALKPRLYHGFMPERPRKRPTDLNRLAPSIVDEATGNAPDPDAGKNPAAVALGRLGGAKGGKARAAKLSPEQRSEIARKAAQVRWQGRQP
jgi:hypothetical protein